MAPDPTKSYLPFARDSPPAPFWFTLSAPIPLQEFSMSTGWIVLGVIVVLVFLAFSAYNRLVALGERVGQAFADVDVQLKQLQELVPSLVHTVKVYASHERGTLDDVIKA